MKFVTILMFVLTLSSISQAAESRLFCKVGKSNAISSATANSFEAFMEDCGDAFAQGTVCFTGARKGVIDIIDLMESADFLGDETEIQNTHYVGRTEVKYTVYDAFNKVVLFENRISACSADFFN